MSNLPELVEQVYRSQSRQVFATLIRLLGDFDLAEEVLHEAFAAAMKQWPVEGVPDNPRTWLISTGRFHAIDIMRRRSRLTELRPEVVARFEEIEQANESRAALEIEDDTLRLIFTCCHPAIAPKVQVPLTLREVCGMTTEEIASAFLTNPSTMAQRIVRGKSKIRCAGIPYVIPSKQDMPDRLDAVLSVIYLVFNEGYSASSGDSLIRTHLSDETIRLARLVLELLAAEEVMGILSLMLLHESRRSARLTPDGDIVLLEDQDRSLWDRQLIAEGKQLIDRAMATGSVGTYTIQAAISAAHADAESAEATDWGYIVQLYDALLHTTPSPVVELNRAAAIAMHDGPSAGLEIIDDIIQRGELPSYHLIHAARGELLNRLGRFTDAKAAFELALMLAKQEPERRFLAKKIVTLNSTS